MSFEEIQELLKFINKSNLTEFIMQDKDFKLTVRTKNHVKGKRKGEQQQVVVPSTQVLPVQSAPQFIPPVQPAPTAAPPVQKTESKPAPPAESNDAEDTSNYLEIKSPMVGTFYRSPSPDKPVFAKVGDNVNEGDVVCIVEAMKLFNEIESEVSGKIVKVLVEDASPVEYDQVLFLVDPKG